MAKAGTALAAPKLAKDMPMAMAAVAPLATKFLIQDRILLDIRVIPSAD
ncbi:MAG: hypothetical protein AB1429_13620 [Pseudomonadota bacterium]